VTLLAAIGAALDHRREPWLGWLLLCLCRQRARQSWLVDVHHQHLSDVDRMHGDVPGLPGWRYHYHGMGLCLSGPNAEALDMDFHDEQGSFIDPYFFATRVHGLSQPPLPEARLRRWLPDQDVTVAALDALKKRELLLPPDGHSFQLSPALEAAHREGEALPCENVAEQLALATALGDGELTGHAPARLQEGYRAWLLATLGAHDQPWAVLDAAAAALPQGEATDLLVTLTEGEVDHTWARAFELLEARGARPHLDAPALLARLEPQRHHPHLAWAAASYFLRADMARERCLSLIEAFAAVRVVQGYHGNPYDGQLAALMLEHAPARALPLVRQALRSSTPIAVEEAAALLAALDQRWCHRELEAALRDTLRDAPATARILATALGHSSSELARRRAMGMTPPPPEHDPAVAGFTFEEVMANSADGLFHSHLEQVRPLAARLLPTLDEDLGG